MTDKIEILKNIQTFQLKILLRTELYILITLYVGFNRERVFVSSNEYKYN